MKRKVLLVCTGNSVRSQVAEAIVRTKLGGVLEVLSAGIVPAGTVHPAAVRSLAEIGMNVTGAGRPRTNPRMSAST